MIPGYGKIWQLHHRNAADIFDGPVVVQEKVDGSQFSFGLVDGKLECRSKGTMLTDLGPICPDLFKPAVKTALALAAGGQLSRNTIYRGEAVCRPKHNTLTYDRAPRGGIVLWEVEYGGGSYATPEDLACEASFLGLECVPTFYVGEVENKEGLEAFLDHDSFLGGCKIEGVVVKNYGQVDPISGGPLMAKLVSEGFKEVHRKDWKDRNPNRADVIQSLVAMYGTEARYAKAVQHLRESGALKGDLCDIGPLMAECARDIESECADELKEALWAHFRKDLVRGMTRGLPDYYKGKLGEAA